jgi:hypothetical protein
MINNSQGSDTLRGQDRKKGTQVFLVLIHFLEGLGGIKRERSREDVGRHITRVT